jgi:hypothetical protein
MPTEEVEIGETFFAPVEYVAVGGSSVSWMKGSKEDLSVTVKREPNDTSYERFRNGGSVTLDGSALEEDISVLFQGDYRAEAGSTVVTVHRSVLKKLSAGHHTLSVYFDNGSDSVTYDLNILVPAGGGYSPGTGDGSDPVLWVTLMLFSGGGLAALGLGGRKRRKTR